MASLDYKFWHNRVRWIKNQLGGMSRKTPEYSILVREQWFVTKYLTERDDHKRVLRQMRGWS